MPRKSQRNKRREIAKKHIDKKLLISVRIFFLIFLVMLGFIIYDVLKQTITIPLGFLGISIGTLLGFIASRMMSISWKKEEQKVVSQMDKLGAVILILYILFSVFRNKILGNFFHGEVLGAFSFSLLTGIMLGRTINTIQSIRMLLIEVGIVKNS